MDGGAFINDGAFIIKIGQTHLSFSFRELKTHDIIKITSNLEF